MGMKKTAACDGYASLPNTPLAEWRGGWGIVLAACAGVATSALLSYSSSLFIEPLQQEFGWSRAQIVSGNAIAALAGALCAPFTGLFVDRLGPRRLGIAAVIAMCLATAMLGLTGPQIWNWRALWVVVAIAIVLIQPSVWTAAVTSVFTHSRGFALAVTLCGASIASIIIPPLTYALIEEFGWRLAWAALGGIWALFTLPLVWFFLSSARDRERLSRAGSPASAAGRAPGRLRDSGILTLRYAKLALAGVSIAAVVVTLGVSLVPLLSSNGLTRAQAAGTASLLGLSSIGGRLAIGMLLDRKNGRFLAAVCVSLPIIGLLILIHNPGSLLAASIAVLIFGLSLGAELDIMAYLTSRYFRLENFGFLFGTMGGLIGLAAANGPLVFNASYDALHSYVPAMWAAIPICLVSATMFLILGPYPSLSPSETAT
ncbi:hypothetical protein V474_02970 [Novosphingobium barchaimii LL02]|uniref:Major facilitator superfamily (MFS) profile domain-containing protein n=2 Tax=Novosphingobium barchaimii TaxID=1420591 RepID=A0A0J7XK59_9SPHN|nr:hypothetical protein V474_02970 [Novosphingobium barchaimii LL02]